MEAVQKAFAGIATHVSQEVMADALGVTSSAVSQYVRGKKTPRAEVLLTAIELWDMRVSFDDFHIGKQAERPAIEADQPTASSSVQLDLFGPDLATPVASIKVPASRENQLTIGINVKFIA